MIKVCELSNGLYVKERYIENKTLYPPTLITNEAYTHQFDKFFTYTGEYVIPNYNAGSDIINTLLPCTNIHIRRLIYEFVHRHKCTEAEIGIFNMEKYLLYHFYLYTKDDFIRDFPNVPHELAINSTYSWGEGSYEVYENIKQVFEKNNIHQPIQPHLKCSYSDYRVFYYYSECKHELNASINNFTNLPQNYHLELLLNIYTNITSKEPKLDNPIDIIPLMLID